MSGQSENLEDTMVKGLNNNGNEDNFILNQNIIRSKEKIHKDISILVSLEVFAAPLIVEELGMTTVDQVKHYIHQTVLSNDAKFMQLINKYFMEIQRFGKISQFKQSLEDLVLSSLDESQDSEGLNLSYLSYNRQKTIRKQFVGLLLLMFCFCKEQNKEVTSFYDLWNEAFPEDLKYKKKLSKYDTIRFQKSNQQDYHTNHMTRHQQQSKKPCNSKKSDNNCYLNNLVFSNESDKLNYSIPKSRFPLEEQTHLLPFSKIDTSGHDLSKQIACSYRYLDPNLSKSILVTQTPTQQNSIQNPEKSHKTDNSLIDSNSQIESASSTVIAFRSVIDVTPSSEYIHQDHLDLENIQQSQSKFKSHKKLFKTSSKISSSKTSSQSLSHFPSQLSPNLNQNSQPHYLSKRNCLTNSISSPNKKIKVNQQIIQGKSEKQSNSDSPLKSQQISQQSQQSQDHLESLKTSVYSSDHNQIYHTPFQSKQFSGNQTDNLIQFVKQSQNSRQQIQLSVLPINSLYHPIYPYNSINEVPNLHHAISLLSKQLNLPTTQGVQEIQIKPCFYQFLGSQGQNINLKLNQSHNYHILDTSQQQIPCYQGNTGLIHFKD